MTGNDIDLILRDRGEAWRAANQHRPGVDWDEVMAPPRQWVWLAVAAVAVAAAAIAVPLAIVASSRTSKPVVPAHTPAPPAVAREGAPPYIVTLTNGELTYNGPDGVYGVSPVNKQYRAVGVSAGSHAAYAAFPVNGCRTEIDRTTDSNWRQLETVGLSSVVKVDGQVIGQPMAVSPDGSKLALVLTEASTTFGPNGRECGGRQVLEVLDLISKQVATWPAVSAADQISSLQWSADGHHLAFLLAPKCLFLASYGTTCPVTTAQTHAVDTTSAGQPLAATPQLLPWLGQHRGEPYGPVFSWHGQWATVFAAHIWSLSNQGGLGHQLARGLPTEPVSAVSSDATGNHLLLTTPGAIYRWDRGRLAALKLNAAQPGW